MPEQPLFEQLDQAIETLLTGGSPPEGAVELLEIARRLRNLPDDRFKTRLKAELQRRTSVTISATAPVREGFRTVTPYITVADGDKLIGFMKRTFDAVEVSRHLAESGHFHGEVRIGDSMLMIGWGDRMRGHEKPTALHIYVNDCDAAYARAIAAGAKPFGGPRAEPADRPYGERSGSVEDASGNYWYIATRFANNPAPEGVPNLMPYLHPAKARPFIEFLKNAFGAEEMGVYEQAGRVMHAAVRIGDAVVEMGEAAEEYRHMSSGFFMYVKDVDEVYRRAIAAGATSLRQPTNEGAAGHRGAALEDPFGHGWYVATPL